MAPKVLRRPSALKDVASSKPVPIQSQSSVDRLPFEVLSYIFSLNKSKYFIPDVERDEYSDLVDDKDRETTTANTGDIYGREKFARDHEIGASGVEHAPDDTCTCQTHGSTFEVVVSHVCRRWRDVALHSPELWTYVKFTPVRPHNYGQLCLERSKNAPVDIHIAFDDAPIPAAKIEEVLDIVMPRVGHWRAFHINVANYSLIHPVLVRMSRCNSAPMLEVLKLYADEDLPEDSVPSYAADKFTLFHGNTPQLKNAVFFSIHVDWPKVHMNSLQELVLGCLPNCMRPSFSDFGRLLLNAPALFHLGLLSAGPGGCIEEWASSVVKEEREDTPDSPTDQITLPLIVPSIRYLEFSIRNDCYIEELYIEELAECLVLPNLKILDLDTHCSDYFLQTIALPSFATGTSWLTGLEKLRLYHIGDFYEPGVIPTVYAAMPRLKVLKIDFTRVPQDWFDELFNVGHGAVSTGRRYVALPALETFESAGIDGRLLCKLVRYRMEAGLPLRRVVMRKDDRLHKEEREWLQNKVEHFVRSGLSIRSDTRISDDGGHIKVSTSQYNSGEDDDDERSDNEEGGY